MSNTAPRQTLLDSRLHAYRDDLADERLRGTVAARRYVAGKPGRVTSGLAPVRRAPDRRTEVLTFYHYGEGVLVFDRADGHAWCQSLLDGYVGYVEESLITGSDLPMATHFVATMGSYAYEAADMRSPAVDFLPRHSPVVAVEIGVVTRDRPYVRLDCGRFLPLGCLAHAPPRTSDIAEAALLYLGCPYLWGGKSFLGIDCSGLVQNAFRDVGVIVPRDVDMQLGDIGVPFDPHSLGDLRREDLIYVPGHVLIAMGGDSTLHADGTAMIVRRQPLSAFLAERGLRLSDCTFRRRAA